MINKSKELVGNKKKEILDAHSVTQSCFVAAKHYLFYPRPNWNFLGKTQWGKLRTLLTFLSITKRGKVNIYFTQSNYVWPHTNWI